MAHFTDKKKVRFTLSKILLRIENIFDRQMRSEFSTLILFQGGMMEKLLEEKDDKPPSAGWLFLSRSFFRFFGQIQFFNRKYKRFIYHIKR